MTIRLRNSFRRTRSRLAAGAVLALALCFGACSEIDCPLDNVVVMKCGLYSSATQKPLSLKDTLTVTAASSDSVLLNRAQGIASFLLPMGHKTLADTLILRFSKADDTVFADTLIIGHANEAHFESVDCPVAFFHQINEVSTTHHAIDSIAIVRRAVNYDDIENLKIYLPGTVE